LDGKNNFINIFVVFTFDNMSQFPNQKLTRKEIKKEYGSIEEWAKSIYNAIASIAMVTNKTSNQNPYEKEVLIDLANGIINMDDFEYVTKPYGEISPNYPAEFRHYDRISSKLHLLIGEEIKRPLNFRAVAINPEAVTEIEEKIKQEVRQVIMNNLQAELMANGALEPDESGQIPEIQEPAEVVEWMRSNYQDSREKQASMALEWLKEFSNLEEVFNKGWDWLLTTGDDIYYTGIASNEPNFRCVDARYFEYDRSPSVEYIEDAQWAYEERWIPSAAVYEEYGEFLDEEDIEAIEQMKGSFSQNVGYGSGIPTVYFTEADTQGSASSSYLEMNSNSIVKVTNFCWKGLRKVGFVSYTDPDSGEILEKMVGEDYRMDDEFDLDIEWKWMNEVWEATKIGEDLYVGVRPRPNQYKSLDNPNKCRLPYTGISNPNMSVVKRVKEIQYLYDIIMYRLELAIARAKGKLMVMDTAQIPTTEGIDIDKWIYYADTSGFAFINSFEEGKGMFQGQRPSFNQFTQIDLTLSNTIQQYIGIADKLDSLIEDITGVTRQRQGQIASNETVGGVERSVVQSSAITEYLFYTHNRVKRRVLTNLIEECKICWLEGKKSQYVMDDMTRKILTIDGEIFNDAEYGVFLSDSQKGNKIKQTVEQLAQAAMQQGQATFDDIIAIMETDSIGKSKSILQKSREEAQQREDQIRQQEQQSQQQALEMQRQMAQEEREDVQSHERDLKEMDMQIKREDFQNKITLKEIDSFKFAQDQDINNNNVPDQLEIEKLRQENIKDVRKNDIERDKLRLKEKELEIKREDLKEKRKKPVTKK
jgi:hypothetical protein